MAEESGPGVDLLGDPWRPPRDPRGRKRHRPSPQTRELVAVLRGGRASEEEIAAQLCICVPTLRKYYFRELEGGVALARNEMVRKLYEKGMEGNVTAMKAYLAETEKTRVVEVARRPSRPRPLGKKEEQRQAAGQVGGIFAPGPAPSRVN